MSNAKVFYFSGTGNSMHVAQELVKRLPGSELVPIVSLRHRDVIEIDCDVVGFVFPVYAYSLPIPVRDFLKKLRLRSTSYVFALATRGGSPCKIFHEIDRLLARNQKALDAGVFVDMPNNYLLSFDLPTAEEIKETESQMFQTLDSVKEHIVKREKWFPKDPHSSFIHENLLYPFLAFIVHRTHFLNMERDFYADSKCTGCGTCAKVCLSEKVKVTDKKPSWRTDVRCFFCFACIHYCPAQAVQVRKSKSSSKGRYSHPLVSADSIARQKQPRDTGAA